MYFKIKPLQLVLFSTNEFIIFFSVDCVGILKLRNADVEARFGLQRTKKRSQNARLVFRIFLHDFTCKDATTFSTTPRILQVVSNRINCSQFLVKNYDLKYNN